ncbi:MAG: RING finger domain-containing protein [Promethearchaeota archaeon]
MPNISFNYCPNCGKKIQKSTNKKVNFCCYCGREFKKKKVNLHDKIQCTVCHELIWHGRSRTIQCSFCSSQYHYSCVSSWLTKHNSCPMCQNVFLKPNLIFSRNRK